MTLLESLKGTYAVLGQDITDLGLEMMAHDLEPYPVPIIQTALSRCRKELKRLTLADILDKLPSGHPGVEEAWSIVSQSITNGGATIIWTEEMREAYGIAVGLEGDMVAARMAFKETYLRLIQEARGEARPPNWSVSLGSDKLGREVAVLDGVEKGRLTPEYARTFLGGPDDAMAVTFLEKFFPKLLS